MKRNEIFERIENLKKDLKDYNKDIITLNHFDRVNSFFNRFHRLILDGSYDGYDYYKNINSKSPDTDFQTPKAFNHKIYCKYFINSDGELPT